MAAKRKNGPLSKRATKKRIKRAGGAKGFWIKQGSGQKLVKVRKNPWKPGKWIKATAVRVRREAGRLVMDIKR